MSVHQPTTSEGFLLLMCTDTDARTQLLSTAALAALILLAATIRTA